MNTHSCSRWSIPLRQTIDKNEQAKKKQAQRDDGFTPMSTIREGTEPRSEQRDKAEPPNVESQLSALQREVDTLRLHSQKLQRQRDEAFQAIDESLESTATNKNRQAQAQSHTDVLKQTIFDLEKRNSVLSERCKTLSAWAEQHRIATENGREAHRRAQDEVASLKTERCKIEMERCKIETEHAQLKAAHVESCDGLSKALGNADKQYSALQRQHAEEHKGQGLALQESTAENRGLKAESELLCTELASCTERLQSAERELATSQDTLTAAKERATEAERTIQSILGVKALLKSAPIPTGLLSKVSGVLQSSVDVLRLADGSRAEQTRLCSAQVATALSELDEEVTTLAAESGAWLAKRDVILRPQSQAA